MISGFALYLARKGWFETANVSNGNPTGIIIAVRNMYQGFVEGVQTTLPDALGGGDVPRFSFSVTDGIISMADPSERILRASLDSPALALVRAEYESLMLQTYVPSPSNQTEMDANLAAYNQLRAALGLSIVS